MLQTKKNLYNPNINTNKAIELIRHTPNGRKDMLQKRGKDMLQTDKTYVPCREKIKAFILNYTSGKGPNAARMKMIPSIPSIHPPESEKDGEPRNQVPEEVSKSEEDLHKIFNISLYFFRI